MPINFTFRFVEKKTIQTKKFSPNASSQFQRRWKFDENTNWKIFYPRWEKISIDELQFFDASTTDN